MEPQRKQAALLVCGAVAKAYRENRLIPADEDEFWSLCNTFGYEDFPSEVKEWESRVGPHIFYPKGILARYAYGMPIPSKAEAFPDQVTA